jgi:hypothetical protein
MRMIRLGARQWEIHRRGECEECQLSSRLRDRLGAQQWLRQFKGNTLAINELRNIVARDSNVGWRLESVSDDEIVERVAQLLSFGAWHVHALQGLDQLKRGSTSETSHAEAPPPSRTAALASKPPALEASTLSSKIDSAALAAVMLQASIQGTPFCPQ